MSFFPTIDVSAAEAEAIARCLHTVAAIDGVHPRELALIGALLAELGTEPEGISPDELAAALPGADHRLLCMKLAYLVAHVEGGVTPSERVVLGTYADALGLAGADRFVLEEQVVEQLVGMVPA